MPDKEKIVQAKLLELEKKYLLDLNKNNLRIRFKNNTIIIRSSIFRIVLWSDLIIVSSLLSLIFRPISEPYRLVLIFVIIYFAYALWEDSKSINTVKINLADFTLRVYHLNPLRYLLLMIFGGYKKKYHLSEIKAFMHTEKYNVRAIFAKNFINMLLKNGSQYILVDVPNDKQCLLLNHFLNDILHLKSYFEK